MHVCRYASMQVCNYASMQGLKHASMQLCKYESMQVCKYESMQVCKYASMQVPFSIFDKNKDPIGKFSFTRFMRTKWDQFPRKGLILDHTSENMT